MMLPNRGVERRNGPISLVLSARASLDGACCADVLAFIARVPLDGACDPDTLALIARAVLDGACGPAISP